MRKIKLYFSKVKTFEQYGFNFFLIGIFFLPSSIVIGILFLFTAFIVSSFSVKKSFFKDSWNYPFMIFGLLILISAIFQRFLELSLYDLWIININKCNFSKLSFNQ